MRTSRTRLTRGVNPGKGGLHEPPVPIHQVESRPGKATVQPMTTGPVKLSEEAVMAKWAEMAPLIDVVMNRIQNPDEFIVEPTSQLAEDDRATNPYQLSHCARWCLNAGVDHLHALKSLVIDGSVIHSAAPYTLVRGALENYGAGFWMLHPPDRPTRVERGLRWWAKNFKDQEKATKGQPNHSPRQPKIAKLVALANAAGCDSRQVKDGYFSTDVLQYADMHSSALPQPYLIWQICSGFAHGRPWASLGMNRMESQPGHEEDVLLFRLTSDYTRLLAVTLPAIHLMTDFLRLYEESAS